MQVIGLPLNTLSLSKNFPQSFCVFLSKAQSTPAEVPSKMSSSVTKVQVALASNFYLKAASSPEIPRINSGPRKTRLLYMFYD